MVGTISIRSSGDYTHKQDNLQPFAERNKDKLTISHLRRVIANSPRCCGIYLMAERVDTFYIEHYGRADEGKVPATKTETCHVVYKM